MTKKILSYLPFAIVVFLLLLAVRIFNLPYPLSVSSTTAEFAVIGEGKIDVRPDVATANVGVTVNNSTTVDEAQKSIDATNNNIVEAMKALGINKSDIKTSNYSIYPNYGPQGNIIVGYNGYVNIDVKVRDTNKVSKVIEEATKAGANQINGIQFSVDNPNKYRQQAREKAIQNAKEQAQNLSKQLGLKLGRIVNMVESQPGGVYPLAQEVGGLGGGGGVQVEPGSQTISSIVTLYFEKR